MAEIRDGWLTKYFDDRPQIERPAENPLGFEIPFPWLCVIEGLLNELDDARAERVRWIPFSERVPDGDSIQLRAKSTSATSVVLEDYERVVAVPHDCCAWGATHWMPLPAFPDNQGGEDLPASSSLPDFEWKYPPDRIRKETTIPEMTHSLGAAWDQPRREHICVYDDVAIMDRKTLEGLNDYSASNPSGAYEGKMWRRQVRDKWFLCWYGPSDDPAKVSINTRPILLTREGGT